MRLRCELCVVLILAVAAPAAYSQTAKRLVNVRGRQQEIYLYPGNGGSEGKHGKVLFSPGDFGMHGYAPAFAEAIASWGYDVYALDTRHYLKSFTGREPLRTSDVGEDYRLIARSITKDATERVALVGWSEGAGLSLLAAASQTSKSAFSGLIVFGMTDFNVLAWRWADLLSYLTSRDPNEPGFYSRDFVGRVAPLPFVMLHSSGDQYVSLDAARSMFEGAGNPKRFVLIQARNHRFEGNTDVFHRALRDGLRWIGTFRP